MISFVPLILKAFPKSLSMVPEQSVKDAIEDSIESDIFNFVCLPDLLCDLLDLLSNDVHNL